MKRFAELLDRLSYEPGRNNKLRLMTDYFRHTGDPDRGYALAALTGALSFQYAKPNVLQTLITERTDPVLFARWNGPRDSRMHVDYFDCRPGGSYRYTIARDDFEAGFRGCLENAHGRPTSGRRADGFRCEAVPGRGRPDRVVHEHSSAVAGQHRGDRRHARGGSRHQSTEAHRGGNRAA